MLLPQHAQPGAPCSTTAPLLPQHPGTSIRAGSLYRQFMQATMAAQGFEVQLCWWSWLSTLMRWLLAACCVH